MPRYVFTEMPNHLSSLVFDLRNYRDVGRIQIDVWVVNRGEFRDRNLYEKVILISGSKFSQLQNSRVEFQVLRQMLLVKNLKKRRLERPYSGSVVARKCVVTGLRSDLHAGSNSLHHNGPKLSVIILNGRNVRGFIVRC